MTILLLIILLFCTVSAGAQTSDFDDGFSVSDNTFNPNRARDSLNASHKEVPKGMFVWSIDERYGDIMPQQRDTAMHLFMNTGFTSGLYGEYNYTGNLGAPRISRIATDRDYTAPFLFTEPYSYFITKPSEIRFTNTLSPITNLSYYSCGDKVNGEDHLKALFATNINKEAGFGFKFDYLYGRGYYQNQSAALFDYTMWGSYIGPRYQAHLTFSFDHMKNAENGGIVSDEYITHPEAQQQSFQGSEIPVFLQNNWNRNNGFHLLLSHRYNVGFYREVPMTEQEKEAKRFAMQAQREKEIQEAAEKASKQTRRSVQTASGGRPDDAKIVGELSVDSLNQIKKIIAEDSQKMIDSLELARQDTAVQDTSWTKQEYVPVTSFIHTLKVDNYSRIYTAYRSPADYYLRRFDLTAKGIGGDSINDETRHYAIRNTFAVGLLEGLNKYVPMGMRLFVAHDFRHYTLPGIRQAGMSPAVITETSYNENDISVGAQLIKTLGTTLHYRAGGELFLLGEDVGDVRLDGTGDLNLRLSARDSVTLRLGAFYHLTKPTFYQRHFQGKHMAWDHDGFNKQMHTHLEGAVTLPRTRTTLRVCYDNLQNYVYLAMAYNKTGESITGYTADMQQSSSNISLITAMLEQNFKVGILKWENRITFQKSSQEDILPVPAVNIWTNLYLDFKIAKVLSVHFGADARYFTSYYAPEYCAAMGQYAVQDNDAVKTKVGNYPIIDVYANLHLKRCRFFAMYSHVNAGSGSMNYFLTPHHPLNDRVLHLGLSWNFFN